MYRRFVQSSIELCLPLQLVALGSIKANVSQIHIIKGDQIIIFLCSLEVSTGHLLFRNVL